MRWKAGCKADKMLEQMFDSGELKPDCGPKDVHESNEELKSINLIIFVLT